MTASIEISRIDQSTPAATVAGEKRQGQMSERIRSATLNLEIGADYLIWSITNKGLFKKSLVSGGTLADAHLDDLAVLVARLTELVYNANLNHGSVNLFLSFPEAMLRSFYVPAVPGNELKQVVIWEANKVFPFPPEGELFDWKIVNTVEWNNARKYQIQAAAVPSARVTSICELLTAKGLRIERVTLTSLAWESFLERLAKEQELTGNCIAIVRLLGHRLGVYCYYRGALEFLRDNIIERSGVADGFEASLQYLEGAAPAPLDDPLSFKGVDPESIVRIVADNLDYYYGRFSQRTVDAIVLALPKEIYQLSADALQEALGVKVCAVPECGQTEEQIGMLPASLMMPAARKANWRSRILDLLPLQDRIARREFIRFKMATYAAAFIILMLSAVTISQRMSLHFLAVEEGQLQSALERIRSSTLHQEITTRVNEQSQWQGQVAELRKFSSEHSRLLKGLSNLTPSDIFLTSINLQVTQDATGQQISSASLTGFVSDSGHNLELRLAGYLKTLQGYPCCRKVELANEFMTISSEGKQLEFSLVMELINCRN